MNEPDGAATGDDEDSVPAGQDLAAGQEPAAEDGDEVATFEPTPEQYAERARRADKATKGALAGILALEALIVLLIPRAIVYSIGLGAVRTTILFVLAGLLVVVAGLVRRPWGIAVGSAMQVFFFGVGIMFVTMFLIGAIFAAIWFRLLMLRQEVIGGRGGIHVLAG